MIGAGGFAQGVIKPVQLRLINLIQIRVGYSVFSYFRDHIRIGSVSLKRGTGSPSDKNGGHKITGISPQDNLIIKGNNLLVLHTLIFEFLNHGTGRLDPSYKAIQHKTRLCHQTVAKALARLKELGIINWIRRCREDRDEDGRFVLRQETNAYAILPPTQWHGYTDPATPEPPHPTTCGATPALPSLVEQAATDARDGDSIKTIVSRLDADPGDALASALARLGRAIGI